MTKKFLDLSGRIDPLLAEILHLISDISVQNGIQFFIVGATARDIFFELLHKIKSRRATLDLDLGIHIAAWSSYESLLKKLTESGHFRRSNIPHRLHYYKEEYPVDIVPFGEISKADGTITWPDKERMSTLGFMDAFNDCYQVKFTENSNITVPVASPAGLIIMKLISWSENKNRAEKDAQDLELIFSHYHNLFENTARLFDYPEILESVQFNVQRAGTVLSGKDTSVILKDENAKNVISKVLSNETRENITSQLAIDMMTKNRLNESEYEERLQQIIDFKAGFYL